MFKQVYFPLHLHTTYSIGDGVSLPEEWANSLQQNDFQGGGIADHGTLSGLWKFQKSLSEKGLKPVLGVEVYVVDEYTRSKERWHLTLFFKNEKGWLSYLKLHKKSYTEGFYYKPRVLIEDVLKLEDVVVLSGCVYNLFMERPEFLKNFIDRFGDDFYLELSVEPSELRQKLNQFLVEARKRYSIKFCFTLDAHYIQQQDAFLREVISCISRNEKLNNSKEINKYLRLLSLEEISDLVKTYYPYLKKYLNEAFEKTFEVAEKCSFQLKKVDFKEILPSFGKQKFLEEIQKGLTEKKIDLNNKEIVERLDKEIRTYLGKDFYDYMLIVKEIIDYAYSKGILVGPGRGSVGGSFVAYLLGIITFNPLDYNLLFERFISPDRIEPPDVDIDFDDEKRDEIIEWLSKKYDVLQVVTYSYWKEKSAFLDVKRVTGYNVKSIWDLPEHLRQIIEKLVNRIRHRSRHAAGYIIMKKGLMDFVPVEKVSDILVTAFDGNDLAELGFVKFDLLGLSTLSLIRRVLELTGKKVSKPFNLLNKHLDKKVVYDEIYNKKRLVGIFQFDTENSRYLLDKYKVENFDDIIKLNALNRPGPLSSFFEDLVYYKQYKTFRRNYGIDFVNEIVMDTGGVFLFQEQIMELFRRLGYDEVEINKIRKYVAKSKREELEKYKEGFINKIGEKGEELWNSIVNFGEYSFNKSHAVAYSLISFMTALLKYRYPVEFYKAFLEKKVNNDEKIAELIKELIRMGFQVYLPSVSKTTLVMEVEDSKVYLGVVLIKGIGLAQAKKICLQDGYKTFDEFLRRVKIPVDVFKVLVCAGYFDDFGIPRKFLYENTQEILKMKANFWSFSSNNEWNEEEKLRKQFEVMPFLKLVYNKNKKEKKDEDTKKYFK
jgi:DNA polymerase-3 subunit alpha